MGQCLHEEIEEISTLLAGSTRVSRRVTRQGGLTRLDYRFHVNAYKHLTAKGLPAAVIQPGLKSNPGSCKEALNVFDATLDSTFALGLISLHRKNTLKYILLYFSKLEFQRMRHTFPVRLQRVFILFR